MTNQTTKTGGSAFPFEGGDNNRMQPDFGMTLRDYFAAKAMQGLISQAQGGAINSDLHTGAQYAYKMADAMIIVRESEIENPNEWIIEKLSYHNFERDDLSIDDCLKYLESEWKEVRGRDFRPLVMQILSLLAASEVQS